MWYSKTRENLNKDLNTNFDFGLSQAEADSRLKKYGYNQLSSIKHRHWLIIFTLSFFQPLSLILLIAGFLMITIQLAFNFPLDYIDFSVLFGTVLINSLIETAEQIKARKSLESLQKLTIPTVVVKRDNALITIPANQLVIGDIIFLEAGKYIPADVRIIKAQHLMINESALTGESLIVKKESKVISQNTPLLAEQKNMAFMSTFITNGRCEGIVVATAKQTEVGKIAASIAVSKHLKTPLQKRLGKLTKLISFMAVVVSLAIFMFFYFTHPDQWPSYIVLSVVVAIALVPESLLVIISIILSLAVQKMSKNHLVVKKLDAIETLGTVNVICSDKTGTLTKNQMTVESLMFNQQKFHDHRDLFLDLSKKQDFHFLNSLILCNDAIFEKNKKIGDPTELALVHFSSQYVESEIDWRVKFPRLSEKPFDSKRKLMSTTNLVNNKTVLYAKGALEVLLRRCSKMFINNKIVKMKPADKKRLIQFHSDFSHLGLRVLGFGVKLSHVKQHKSEKDLIFLGAVGMMDPPRDEVVMAINKAKNAHIEVIMITGDHKETALAIAKKLNIASSIDQVMDGITIDQLSNKQLIKHLKQIRVFARVNPEHKTRIVQCLQKLDKIVAMTGDGVNDAPSLSSADVGIAMGKSGTDVAKDASKIVLQDDNFATIIKGIETGRNVFQKIRHTIIFVFASNIAEVLVFIALSLFSRLLGAQIEPLGSVNILYFNLIVESFLSIAMSVNHSNKNIMFQKPSLNGGSFFKNTIMTMVLLVIITTLTVIATYFIAVYVFGQGNLYDANAKIATVLVMISAPAFYSYTLKLPLKFENKKHFYLEKIPTNYALQCTIILVLILNALLIYTPGVRNVFITVFDADGHKIFETPILSWQMSIIAWPISILPALILWAFIKTKTAINKHQVPLHVKQLLV